MRDIVRCWTPADAGTQPAATEPVATQRVTTTA